MEYLSAHAEALPEEARQRMADNPMRLFDTKDPAVETLMAGAPRVVDALSDAAAGAYVRVGGTRCDRDRLRRGPVAGARARLLTPIRSSG